MTNLTPAANLDAQKIERLEDKIRELEEQLSSEKKRINVMIEAGKSRETLITNLRASNEELLKQNARIPELEDDIAELENNIAELEKENAEAVSQWEDLQKQVGLQKKIMETVGNLADFYRELDDCAD